MKQNVGKTDKLIRIIAGLLIIALGIYFSSWWGLVAIVPLATALTGFCPVYALFGVNTCSTNIKVHHD
jgi:hypothetical protein